MRGGGWSGVGGRQRRGRKFYYFPAASVFLPSILNSIFIIVSIAESLF